MKYLWYILFFIVWLIVFFELVSYFPINLILISDIMLEILAFAILVIVFLHFWKNQGITNYSKIRKILLDCDKLPKEKYFELAEKILFARGNEDLGKPKGKTPYGVSLYNKKTIYSFNKTKEPMDFDFINVVAEGKLAFGVSTAVVLNHKGFTKEAVNLAEEKNIILWDTKRLLEILDSIETEKKQKNNRKVSKKTHISMELKESSLRVEDLDFCNNEEFEKYTSDLLLKNYKYIGKEGNFYKFIIEEKEYAVAFLKSNNEGKIGESDVQNIFSDIYAAGYSNAIVLTNGYYNQNLVDLAHKLKIDLWNRDNISYMIKKIK